MRPIRLAALVVTSLMLPLSSPAQEAAQAPVADESAQLRGIEEIIVTAERREQNLQDVAQAISAFSFDALTEGNIQDAYDLQLKVPGLVATGGLPAITLRGLGQDTDVLGPGIDPGFQLHVNDIYVAQIAVALLGFHDFERVEVLPGPQGTLYGRNSTGGSMNFHTRRPKLDTWEVSGDLDIGRWQNLRLRGVVNIPILEEKLAARIAFLREFPSNVYELEGQNGLRKELTNNALSGGVSLRASVRYVPSDSVTFDLIGAWTKDNDDGGTSRPLEPYPTFPAGQSLLFGSVDYSAATPLPSNPRRHRANRTHEQFYETYWGQAILAVEIPHHELKLNANYQYWDYAVDFDEDFSDVDAIRLVLLDKHKTWTGEATLRSSYESDGWLGRLSWLFGANYQTDEAPNTDVPIWFYQQNAAAASYQIFDAFDVSTPLSPASPNALRRCGGPCIFQPFDDSVPGIRLRSDVDTETVGVFADASFDLLEELTLSAGVRYSRTDREMLDMTEWDVLLEPLDFTDNGTPCNTISPGLTAQACFNLLRTVLLNPLALGFGGVPVTNANTAFLLPLRGDLNQFTANTTPVVKDERWESVTGRVRLEFRPAEGQLFYGSVSTGERHGGFNFLVVEPFDSEEIIAYEIGAKNSLFDNRLFLNTSVFYYDFDKRFANETQNNVTVTTNVPKSEVMGVEVQLIALPVERLQLSANFGWLHTEITSDFNSQDNSPSPANPTSFCPFKPVGDRHGVGPTCDGVLEVNLRGQSLPRAPKWTVSTSAEYAIEFASGTLTPRVDFAWRDEVFYRLYESPLDRQGAYTRTDARLRWDVTETPVWFEVYAQNLENREKVRTQVSAPGWRSRNYWLATPLTFGFRLGWKFEGGTFEEMSPF
jgi:iron complex outermembrane receptor protein